MTESNNKVNIGLLNECEPWRLHARFFPSKVGGKPAWLHRKPPQPSSLLCEGCNEPLIFLCQIYAPIDDVEDAFHRTLYVFICKNGSCYKPNYSHNIKIFRSQLRRENEFYSSEPPIEEENLDFDDSKCPPLCYVCGCKGPSHCSKCKSVNYCSKSHQIYHWKHGHREHCCNEENAEDKFKNDVLFAEWELIVEEEKEVEDIKTTEEKELEYFNKLVEEQKTGCLNEVSEEELDQYANKSIKDKTFSKFKKRISRDPDQILRYDRGGTPLFISSQSCPSVDDIPNCQYCNGRRQFEFQIMPQLLHFLELDYSTDSIDWGILAIYTCTNHCNGKDVPYKSEYVFKQDIVTDSLNSQSTSKST